MLRLKVPELDLVQLPADFQPAELQSTCDRKTQRPRYSDRVRFEVQALRTLCLEFKDMTGSLLARKVPKVFNRGLDCGWVGRWPIWFACFIVFADEFILR